MDIKLIRQKNEALIHIKEFVDAAENYRFKVKVLAPTLPQCTQRTRDFLHGWPVEGLDRNFQLLIPNTKMVLLRDTFRQSRI